MVAIFAVGCGGASIESGSCNLSSASLSGCDEFSAPSGQIASLKTNCTMGGGTWKDAPCSRMNALGGCELVAGDVTTVQWFYQGGNFSTVDMIKAYCAQSRTMFVAP
jgi:hypothetical protein